MYQGALIVGAPPGTVFQVLMDHRTYPEWMTGLVTARRRSHGPARVGTRTDLVLAQAGVEITLLSEIVELEPARLFGVRLSGDGLEGMGRHRLEPVRHRTRVHSQLELTFKGPLGLAGPLVAGYLKRKVEADLAALKEFLEGAS